MGIVSETFFQCKRTMKISFLIILSLASATLGSQGAIRDADKWIKDVIQDCDADGDNEVDEAEMNSSECYHTEKVYGLSKSQIPSILKKMDKDNNGKISFNELKSTFQAASRNAAPGAKEAGRRNGRTTSRVRTSNPFCVI